MKKCVLFLTGVLSLFVYSGCYDDPLDSKPPDGKTVAVFDVRDARAWFEDHAEELHLLHLKSSPETKYVGIRRLFGRSRHVFNVFMKNVGEGNRIRCGSWAIRCVDVKDRVYERLDTN